MFESDWYSGPKVSRQFQFLTANNAHGIFRFAQHLSTSDNFGGRQWPPKVKTQDQKSIFDVDLQREKRNPKSKVDSRTLMPVDSE